MCSCSWYNTIPLLQPLDKIWSRVEGAEESLHLALLNSERKNISDVVQRCSKERLQSYDLKQNNRAPQNSWGTRVPQFAAAGTVRTRRSEFIMEMAVSYSIGTWSRSKWPDIFYGELVRGRFSTGTAIIWRPPLRLPLGPRNENGRGRHYFRSEYIFGGGTMFNVTMIFHL